MTPDRDTVAAFLHDVEAHVNRGGWDVPAQMAEIHRSETSLGLNPVQMPRRGPPADHVAQLADWMTTGAFIGGPLVQVLSQRPSFFGYLMVVEAWVNDDVSPEDDHKHMADILGSYEERLLLAVDIRGNAYGIARRRGQEPVEHPPVTFTGRLIQSLHAMTLAVAEQMPPGLADLDALRRCEAIPTADEQAAWESGRPRP